MALACGTLPVLTAGATPPRLVHTSAGNRHAARLDVQRRLGQLVLPSGATRSATEPAGDGGLLKPASGLVATTARIDAYRWWRVPGDPASVLAYVKSHTPAAAKLYATGTTSTGGGRSSSTVDYGWRPIPGVLGVRELAVTVTALPGGVTGLLAQAESDWIVPRPASERIPARAREIDITSAKVGGPTSFSLNVTNAADVRRIKRLINAMSIVQPAAIACPDLIIANAHVLTLTFRTHSGGRQLARAIYTDYLGPEASSGPCDPVQLTIGGRGQDPLIGGRLVQQLDQLLHVSVTGSS